MLKGKGLPNHFWAKTADTTIYILNCNYTKAIKGQTPHEAYSGKKPSISHFRTVGCECYVHVPDAKRNKLQPKSNKCIFLGYSDERKAYRLYNPTTKKIVASRNVVFKEQPHAKEDANESYSLSPDEEVTYYEIGPSNITPTLKGEKVPSSNEEFKSLQPNITQ